MFIRSQDGKIYNLHYADVIEVASRQDGSGAGKWVVQARFPHIEAPTSSFGSQSDYNAMVLASVDTQDEARHVMDRIITHREGHLDLTEVSDHERYGAR